MNALPDNQALHQDTLGPAHLGRVSLGGDHGFKGRHKQQVLPKVDDHLEVDNVVNQDEAEQS